MKKYIMIKMVLGLYLILQPFASIGQLVIPDQSPFSTVTQKIGFSEMRIEYSRPSVRGRVIFGDLVPYGKVWRTGANSSTKIYFQEPITINDTHKLTAGIYSIYTIPGKDSWTIIFSQDPWLWRAYDYQEKFDVLRFTVKPQALKDQVETFTIQFANVCISCAEVQLMWDYTQVAFRVSTSAEERVLHDIKTFTSNPEAKMAGDYFLAAKYYLDTGRDLNKAMEWINKALEYGDNAYWFMHTKAEIQAKMGDYKGAIESANLSKQSAEAKNDMDYVRMNEREIENWKKIKKNK